MPLLMRFNGPLLNDNEFWQHSFHNSKATLDLLMGPSSKSISIGTICPIIDGLMGLKKICMNNMIIVDHHWLFIYLDLEYPRSYYDVSILH